MSKNWKAAVEHVNGLDEDEQDAIAAQVMAMASRDDEDDERVRALIAEAEADIAAGRYQIDSDEYWKERLSRLKSSAVPAE